MSRAKDAVIALTAIGMVGVLPSAVKAQEPGRVAPENAAPDSILSGATITLRVDGLSCPFCAYGLEKRLKEIPAVDTLVVRVSDGIIQIRTKDGQELDDAALHDAVDRAGFSLREIHRVERP